MLRNFYAESSNKECYYNLREMERKVRLCSSIYGDFPIQFKWSHYVTIMFRIFELQKIKNSKIKNDSIFVFCFK